ncbi:MAG: hypothetical protein H7Y22_08190 [Gemmatimonadaceae bacterium]|nr:hypothetical protein [Gloeobacterales cyanobacterium ES-bin-141]
MPRQLLKELFADVLLAVALAFLFWGMWQFPLLITGGLVLACIILLHLVRPGWSRLASGWHLRVNQLLEWPLWRRVASIHEAGHVIVAHRLGMEVAGYALTPAASALHQSSGYTSFKAEHFSVEPEKLLTTLTVLVAGKVCEELVLGHAHGATHDLRQLECWAQVIDESLVNAGHQPVGIAFWQKTCETRAKQLLVGQEQLIEAVAGAMLQREVIERILEHIDSHKVIRQAETSTA